MGSDGRFGKVMMVVGGVLALFGLVAIMMAGCAQPPAEGTASASEVSDVMADVETYSEEYLQGQPLDAVRLSAPSFASGSYCYRVTDRTSGACWYLVQMPDGDGHWRWQVLTVGVGEASPGLIVPNNESAETK